MGESEKKSDGADPSAKRGAIRTETTEENNEFIVSPIIGSIASAIQERKRRSDPEIIAIDQLLARELELALSR